MGDVQVLYLIFFYRAFPLLCVVMRAGYSPAMFMQEAILRDNLIPNPDYPDPLMYQVRARSFFIKGKKRASLNSNPKKPAGAGRRQEKR